MSTEMVSIAGRSVPVDRLGSGRPVMFLHGFPFNRSMWRGLTKRLTGVEVFAPDLAGMGEATVRPGRVTLADYAADVDAVLDMMELDSVVLGGLSMGGYVVFELLRNHSERIAGTVLFNTRADRDDADTRAGRDRTIELVQREGAAAVAVGLLPKLLTGSPGGPSADLHQIVREMIEATPVEGIVGALGAMRDRPDSTGLLAAIRVPTLVVAGREDRITPPDGMRRMAARIPNATFVEIEAAGHLTPMEQPEATAAAVQAFVDRL